MSNALKLGTATGSLINHVYSSATDKAPAVGDGVTILLWSDRRAGTIVEISKNGKRVGVVEDEAKRVDSNGMSESQEYEFSPGNGSVQYYTLRKNGQYVREGSDKVSGTRIKIGARSHYYDYSF